MGNKTTLASTRRDYVERVDEEAEELGLSRNKYVRQRLNAGRLLFQAGKLDVELLEELMETDGAERQDTDIETLDGDISQRVLSLLSTDEDRAATVEELRRDIFGTKQEQEELLTDVLKQLNDQGKIRPAFDEGYVKND